MTVRCCACRCQVQSSVDAVEGTRIISSKAFGFEGHTRVSEFPGTAAH